MTLQIANAKSQGARRWTLRRGEAVAPDALARTLGVSGVVAGLLAARGITSEESARALLKPSRR